MSDELDQVLLTVTGHDQPGILARLTQVLAEVDAPLCDVEQVVIKGRLTLCLLVRLPERNAILKRLLGVATEFGVDLDFQPLPQSVPCEAETPVRYAVTAIAASLGARELSYVASCLAAHNANIDRISRLSEGNLRSIEILLTLPKEQEPSELKGALLQCATTHGFDLALQREGLYRRSKRMVVMDMDSTLIRIEVIDELARAQGVGDEVMAITERAMHGEMDYDESLRQRVALLRGLPVEVLERIASTLPLTEGAETLIRVLKRLGYRTAVLSGGFSVAADALKARLGIDYAYSNVLEAADGKLTGRTVGPVVNAQRKADLLQRLADAEDILLDQIIAVGDGANDLLMLQKAGLGIAFRAKPKLRAAAHTAISAGGLDSILYLLGISARELGEV